MSLPALTRILMAVAGRVGACRLTDADVPRSGAAGNRPFAGCRPRQAGAGALDINGNGAGKKTARRAAGCSS